MLDERPTATPRYWPAWAVLGFLWLILLNQLRYEWDANENYSYGFFVPILALYLLFQKWQTLELAEKPDASIPRIVFLGMILLAGLFLPFRLVQEAAHQWRFVGWGMAFVVVGITLGLSFCRTGSRGIKQLAFPVAFILTSVPWLSVFEGPLTQHLRNVDTRLATFALNWLGISALQKGNLIDTAGGLVGIDEACSGIRSLQITLMISLFLGELYRFSFFRRAALVLSGWVAAFACNVARTFALAWCCARYGGDALEEPLPLSRILQLFDRSAVVTLHDVIGYAVLAVLLGCLWVLAALMKKGQAQPEAPAPATAGRVLHFRPWPRRFILFLGAWLLLAEIGTEAWYRVHEIGASHATMWNIQYPVTALGFKEYPLSKTLSDKLKFTDGRNACWSGEGGISWNVFFFRWTPGPNAAALARSHNPEVCMPSAGLRSVVGREDLILKVNGLSIPFVHYIYDDAGRRLHVWWCVWNEKSSTQQALSPRMDSKFYTGALKDVLRGQRNLGHQVLEIGMTGERDSAKANAALGELLSRLIVTESASEWTAPKP